MLRTTDGTGKTPDTNGGSYLSPREMYNGIPVLRGEIVGGQLKIRCPHCRYRGRQVFHFHGWDSAAGPDALGHRMAHCHNAAILFRGGYFIGVAPVGGGHSR